MIELVLLACLVDKPASCRDVGVMYSAENLTPMQCLMQAPPHMAKLGRRASRLEGHEVVVPPRGPLRQDLATEERCEPRSAAARTHGLTWLSVLPIRQSATF